MKTARVVPDHLEEIFPRQSIEARLGELAMVLDSWADEAQTQTLRPLLTVCVLRGGVFFFSDLLLRMNRSAEPGFVRAWSYRKDGNEAPEATVRLDWQELGLRDRDVVLIDNICDSGRTLDSAGREASAAGARSVRSVTLIFRQGETSYHRPTLTGFVYAGPEWLVGYGLRDRGALMNLPSVHRIRAS